MKNEADEEYRAIVNYFPYFDVVVGLAWSHDPESCVGGSVATGRTPMPDRSKVMIQTKRDTLVLLVGCWPYGYKLTA
jgi:hypothetical protein